MLFRFALYGFLKNQRYFEPFFFLYLLQLEMSFWQIGVIIGVRELLLNIFEIPSGALADIYGRRRCMVFSFTAYVISFVVLALSTEFWHCLLAMLPFAMGDAFRTGTHKAMIFTWLRQQERTDEKQKIYGYTRSWSKWGSALSIPIACAIVLITNDYTYLFWASLLPYLIGLYNLATYPSSLDAEHKGEQSALHVVRQSFTVLKQCMVQRPLRRLLVESMSFEGVFKSNKDYIQPIIVGLAISIPAVLGTDEAQRTAIIIAVVYMFLHIMSAFASRLSHRVTEYSGSEDAASRHIWYVNGLIYIGIFVCLFFEWHLAAVLLFMFIHVIQNLWRPLIVSRFDEVGDEKDGATLLSVESQSRSFACMLLAPLLGLAVDYCQHFDIGGHFSPVAALGILSSLFVLVLYRR